MKAKLSGFLAFCVLAVPASLAAQDTHAVQDVAEGYNNFGLKVLAQVRQAAPGKNVFISPAGLAFALSMVADGARGETLAGMMTALQLKSEANLDQANRALLAHLATLDPKIALEIANSVWTAEDAKIKPAYLAGIRENYSAEVSSVDFRNPATAQRINGWVSDHTQGRIPEMVKPPLDANRLILLDAIYFKGDWTAPFNEKLTRALPFTLADGQAVTHPRMSRTGNFEYYEDDACQAVRLPYGGREMGMFVLLPKKSLGEFLQTFAIVNWADWARRFHSRRGTLELPRLKLENSYDLKKVLMALGMSEAFTPHADFHGIADERLHIDWVRQKTYVDVNEKGTEAAAATGVGIVASAVRREPPPFHMIVDRPFFMAICDQQTGMALFLGAIMDPRS